MASVLRATTPLQRFWSRRAGGERVMLIAILVVAVGAAVLFLKLGNNQTYVTAFTNLEARDSAAVADQLKAQKIPYQVTPDGSTIKVPPGQLADARLKMASKGLPQGGAVGFELFDKTSFGVTDFVQNVNYQRALEGELTRTIDTLEQVEGSRVHIVVPKDALFVSEQKPATASVVLRLRPGRTLDASQLRGIGHMIARSVEGLDEKNITILDSSGQLLFDGSAEDSTVGGLTATQLDTQHKIEQGLQSDLQALLDRVTGLNRSLVRVKADLDFSQSETVSETYTPAGPNGQGVTRSSSTTQESYNGATGPGGQIPGASANVPGAATAGATPPPGAQYQRSESTTNYELTKTTQKQTTVPGTIKRLSVSVFLDNSISEQDAAGLHDAVAAAAGIDPKRGDQVVITTAGFSANAPAEPITVARTGILDTVKSAGKVAAPILLALIVLVAVWRMSRSMPGAGARATVIDSTLALPPAGGLIGPVMPAAMSVAAAPASVAPAPAVAEADGARSTAPLERNTQTSSRSGEIHDRLVDLAGRNPEAVANIVRGWMNRDEGRS